MTQTPNVDKQQSGCLNVGFEEVHLSVAGEQHTATSFDSGVDWNRSHFLKKRKRKLRPEHVCNDQR